MEARRGFTFVEILIVIGILGILTTLIMGNYITSLKRGRDGRRKADLMEIKTALMMYHNDFGGFPGHNGDNKILGCTDGLQVCNWGEKWEVTTTSMIYMKILPSDPLTSVDYQYAQMDSGNDFCLWTALEYGDDPEISGTHTRCSDCTFDFDDYVVCAD